jgi:hypothetical protein
MQISVELVDWAWLTRFANPRAMIDALLDEDKRQTAPYHEMCYDFLPDWIDSAGLVGEVEDALETLVGDQPHPDFQVDKRTALLIRAGLLPLLAYSEPAQDDLQLAPASDGCFFASLSPESARAAARAVRELDLGTIAGKLDPEQQPLFHTILQQWATAIFRAEERGAGMIGHCG